MMTHAQTETLAPLADRLTFDTKPHQWQGARRRRPSLNTKAGVELTRSLNPDAPLRPSLSDTGVAPGSALATIVATPGVTRRHRRALIVAITSIGKPRHARLKRRAFKMFAEIGVVLR